MISYILRSIRERGIRSLLLIIGVLVVSTAFALLLATVETTKVTVEEDIAKYWRTTYDILVRPSESRSLIEEDHNLVQANHLSNLEGGISLEEWDIIKAIPGVAVAAPIALLGHFNLIFHIPIDIIYREPGFYRLENKLTTSDGLHKYETVGEEFFYCSEAGGPLFHLFDNSGYNLNVLTVTGKYPEANMPWFEELVYRLPILLAAIDPVEENKLIDLEQTFVEGEYLHNIESTVVPIVMNKENYVNFSLDTYWYRIQTPFDEKEFDQIQSEFEKEHLAKSPVELIDKWQFEGQDAYEIALTALREHNSEITNNSISRIPPGVSYREITASPGEYDTALEAITHGSSTTEHAVISMPLVSFDRQTIFRETESGGIFGGDIQFLLQGIYDIEELATPENISQVPLETYYPPNVILLYDESGEPLTPVTLSPTFNTKGYITSPTLALTTIQVSNRIGFNTKAPISAIRVQVSGIDDFTPDAQSKIETVAAEIIERTDLDVDITVGSSPKKILVHLPTVNQISPIGYVEEGWVQMGLSYDLAQEVKRVNILLFLVMFIVAGLYILNTSLVSTLGRQREIALQKALGWRDSSVFFQVVLEGALIGLGAGVLGLVGAIGLASLLGLNMPIERAVLVLPMSIGLCLIGSLIPAYIASKTPPGSKLTRGEISDKSIVSFQNPTVVSLALHEVLRRRARALLAILTILTSTALITIYIGSIIYSQGYLAGTFLGDHILVHIGGFQLAIAGISFLVAGIAIADILLITVIERRHEIGILKAIGWRSVDVTSLFLYEGVFFGLIGGISGVLLGIILVSTLLDITWSQRALIGVIALLIPIVVGLISSIFPARIASQTPPAEAVRYE